MTTDDSGPMIRAEWEREEAIREAVRAERERWRAAVRADLDARAVRDSWYEGNGRGPAPDADFDADERAADEARSALLALLEG